MTSHIECPKCKFKISGKMEHTIKKGECPSCGENVNLGEALGVLQFLDIIEEMQLPLQPVELDVIVDKYFRGVLEMTELPKIVIEQPVKEKVANSARRKQIEEPEEPELKDVPASDTVDMSGGTPLFGSKAPGKKRALIADSKFTKEELAEIAEAEKKTGIKQAPLATVGNPNRVDSKTQGTHAGDKGIKFYDKATLMSMGGIGKRVSPEEADAIAEQEVQAEGFPPPTGVPAASQTSSDRPVLLPKISNSTTAGTGAVITDPDAIITPKSILGDSNG